MPENQAHQRGTVFAHACHGFVAVLGIMLIATMISAKDAPHPGLYPVRAENGKWGFIDATGTYRIPPIYTGAGEFSDGVAYVYRWQGDRRINGIVDAAGKFTELPTNDYPVTFSEGLARVQTGSGERLFGFVDRTGREVIPRKFYDAGPFSEGLAWVAEWHDRQLLYGYIDRSGRYVIPLQFKSEPRDFHHGHAWAPGEYAYGMIDRAGKMVFTDQVSWVDYSYSEGLLAAITSGEIREGVYLDPQGRVAFKIPAWNERTKTQLADAHLDWLQLNAPFQEGLAPFRSFNKIGFIDRTGTVTIAAQFRDTNGFSGGRAAVKVIGSGGEYVWGYIDRSGEMVIIPKYREAKPFDGPLARVVTSDGIDQLIDRTGRVIWSAKA
jgi:hypothetical protein